MTSSDDLLRSARAGIAGLGPRPKRRLAIVTCMDTRIDPLAVFGVSTGDVHVMRNAGGVVTSDVVRSLAVSQRRLDTNAIDLMMHTECGMLGLDEDALRREIAAGAGRPVDMRLHAFANLHDALREGVGRLRASPALAHRDRIRGLVYDLRSRRTSVVVP